MGELTGRSGVCLDRGAQGISKEWQGLRTSPLVQTAKGAFAGDLRPQVVNAFATSAGGHLEVNAYRLW